MGVNPAFSFWFGVFTSVLLVIGGSTISFTNLVPPDWIPIIKGWAMALGTVNSVILTALHGVSSSSPGPLSGKG